MTSSQDSPGLRPGQTVAVVGGGIVGLSCAFHLRRKGLLVHVIDPGIEERRASFGNAGVLATCDALPLGTPQTLRAVPAMLRSPTGPLRLYWPYLPHLLPWLVRFAAASRPSRVQAASLALAALLERAVDAHRELARHVGAESLLAGKGWLKAFESEAAYRRAEPERRALRELGIPMQELDARACDELCPGAAGVFARATLYTGCGQIRQPGRYAAQTQAACAAAGIRFHAAEARGFVFRDGLPAQVRTDAGDIPADAFVLAAGAWSRPLARQLGSDVPLDTEGGYHLMLAPQAAAAFEVPTLWSEKSLVLSPLESGLRITGVSELAGLDAPARYATIEQGLLAVRRAMPRIDAPVQSRWRGFRPSMPDSLPVIGPDRAHPNCHFAFGHGHLGLTLGPLTGKLVADMVVGEPTGIDMAPYSPARFRA